MLATCLTLATLVAVAPADPVKPKPVEVEIRCYDGSILKAIILDEILLLQTKYGEMKVPASSLRRVEFAGRTPSSVSTVVSEAVSNLGHPDFTIRETATQTLKDLKDRAYPACLPATKSADPEVARRAVEICKSIEDKVGRQNLSVKPFDIIHTDDSKLSGTLKCESLKVMTAQFGEQQLRLSDIREVRHKDEGVSTDVSAIAAPANMSAYPNQVGKEFSFKLVGAAAGVGNNVWGTDIYTLDSNLAVAAVHAGVLKVGEAGVVKIRLLVSPQQFAGLDRNGVTSAAYGNYPAGGYEFVK